MGKRKLPKTVAQWLGKDDPKSYTTHSWRRSAATLHVDMGANPDQLQRAGRWKSNSARKHYVDNSNRAKLVQATAMQLSPALPGAQLQQQLLNQRRFGSSNSSSQSTPAVQNSSLALPYEPRYEPTIEQMERIVAQHNEEKRRRQQLELQVAALGDLRSSDFDYDSSNSAFSGASMSSSSSSSMWMSNSGQYRQPAGVIPAVPRQPPVLFNPRPRKMGNWRGYEPGYQFKTTIDLMAENPQSTFWKTSPPEHQRMARSRMGMPGVQAHNLFTAPQPSISSHQFAPVYNFGTINHIHNENVNNHGDPSSANNNGCRSQNFD